MIHSVHLTGFCALLSVASLAGARTMPMQLVETPSSPTTLVLVDDLMVEEADSEDWRLSTDAYERDVDGDVRLRVKLRPNRAMGRMSLPF